MVFEECNLFEINIYCDYFCLFFYYWFLLLFVGVTIHQKLFKLKRIKQKYEILIGAFFICMFKSKRLEFELGLNKSGF